MRVPTELQQYFGKYVRILKSLYGLKQAAVMWYLLVSNFLKRIEFSPMAVDPTVFRHPGSGVVVGIHVDDFMLTGEDEVAIRSVNEQVKGRFEMKDLGEGESILGIQIRRQGRSLQLTNHNLPGKPWHSFSTMIPWNLRPYRSSPKTREDLEPR